MTVRVYWVASPKHYEGRSGQAVIALVHHRMVGTLKGTDSTFTTGTREASTNFGVGINCGKAGHPTGLAGAHVHQYVHVDDAAWGNGNLSTTGSWDNVYGATPNPNFRTISIEHHDNGGLPLGEGKGVVPAEVIAQSIELDRLLLSGDWAAWKAAGIRAGSDALGASIAAQVKRIVPSTKTIIDHNYISGSLKPYCWKPWADDRVGFPQAKFIAALTAVPTPPSTGEDMDDRIVPEARGTVKAGPVYRDYALTQTLVSFAADIPNVQVFGHDAKAAALRVDLAGGDAMDIHVGYVPVARLVLNPVFTQEQVTAAKQSAALYEKNRGKAKVAAFAADFADD